MTEQHAQSRSLWFVSDQEAASASLATAVEALQERGIEARWVTISEVLGTVARGALAEGAERIIKGLRIADGESSRGEDFLAALQRKRPDVLVVTNPRYARALAMIDRVSDVESVQVGLIDGFGVDQAWLQSPTDYFVVPGPEEARQLESSGIDEAQIREGGPTVLPAFLEVLDGTAEAAELKLASEKPTVLVRATGFSKDRIAKVVFQCSLVEPDCQFIFHHDGDRGRAAELRRCAEEYGLKAAMFGQVPDLERYVAASDRVVAASDDAMLAEILAQNTPTMVVHQRRDIGHLADRKWVRLCDPLNQLGTHLEDFVSADDEAVASELETWEAADAQTKLVESLEWMVEHGRVSAAATASQVTAGSEDVAEDGAPFESIGSTSKVSDEDAAEDADRSRSEADDAGRSIPTTMTRAEAKEELATLILSEREIERSLKDCQKQQRRWRDRLELAREWGEDDLEEEAAEILAGYVDEAGELEGRLDQLRRQKEKLKQAAKSGSGRGATRRPSGYLDEDDGPSREGREPTEDRFRQMEVDRDLEGLKDRIRRELGED